MVTSSVEEILSCYNLCLSDELVPLIEPNEIGEWHTQETA
jgi:hypothetical protein